MGIKIYNKLFTKILDSTIWLEDDATRLVWITMLAAMDEDGFVALSSPGNVAARARVDLAAAKKALEVLSSPDTQSSLQDNDGRRIERVPSGWIVLNATKYRELVSREESKKLNRIRVARHRARNASVMVCNDDVTQCNETVMQSEAYTEALHTQTSLPALQSAKRGSVPAHKKPKIGRSRKTVFPDEARNLVAQLKTHILDNNPDAKITDSQLLHWTREADLMLRVDHRDSKEATDLLDWSQHDPFWRVNILSIGKFRQQYDRLTLQAHANPKKPPRSQLPHPSAPEPAQVPGPPPLCANCGTPRDWHAVNGAGHSLALDRFNCAEFQLST